ncbi:polysaccharide biosynthesis/export family protein [Cupriavidus oxalaticus]|uniref:SLBB domain-containing protein n=3 Tax=Cupriavidus oxalaticus TaxID=96344 RepID=A0ABX7HQJ5_9BURK|nr:polysaccharide biosynthesis/export family protein [Cupriavidus oxalaticus]QRQ83609.1 SLBB domain-containing protein [Cupriavidus oxalaticus]QRQ92302.1 SLBB domain-containing protein [Cupriavidus oxalaticus]WQD86915.1 polysaccharide biosynthesis/export family protein [Cupriavidus oxalaticus]
MLARRLIDFLACAAMAISCAGVVHAQGGTGLPGIPRATALVPMELAAPASQAGTVAAPVLPAKTEPPLPDNAPQNNDYAANMASDAFGAQLFTGAFSRDSAAVFNPSHVIAVGDRIQLRIWNGYNVDTVLAVDAGGNILLPEVGPFHVQGTTNGALQATVSNALRRVFASKVSIYASLLAAQPVRVYVTGAVRRPGLYDGTSSDSVLRYLDQAGGVDPERGSFLDVAIRRGNQTLEVVNLYDFLLRGELPARQLNNGDVILVQSRKKTVKVTGLAENARRFEFPGEQTRLADLVRLARPLPQATNVRVVRNTGTVRDVEYFPIMQETQVALFDGDEIEFTADKRPGTITVRVEGAHDGPQEYVLPYGSRMGQLVGRLRFTAESDADSIQLFRQSVKARQKLLLNATLQSLEASVLTARAGTAEEAQLRREEAALVLQWVERARKIEPSGQTLIGQASGRDGLLLENGDILRVPVKDGLVLISGEVLFPNAVAYDKGMDLDDFIRQAGGFSQNADTSRVLISHRDGSFSDGKRDDTVHPGDEIMVLPKVDFKTRQFTKDVFQILYQIAISAKVVLGL